jgi:DNA-binding CsgD family transcriptional regulator
MADDLGPLSERELEVLKLVATGATNQQIARALFISPNTVKVHLRNIFEKLGVQSRTEATMEAVRRGWVTVPGVVVPAGEEPVRPLPLPRPAIARWQRIYMIAVAVLVVVGLALPAWWRGQSQAPPVTPFTDVGQPEVPVAPRPQVPRWASAAPLPEPRSRLALVADEDRLYAIGGETAAGVTDQVTIYDPRSNSWSAAARKPTPVSNIAGALVGGLIYVPGGSTAGGGTTNVLEVYDPRADAWEARAPLPTTLAAYGLAAWEGKLYLFGGWDGTAYRSETYIYDPRSDSWTEGTPMTEPRAFLAAGVLGGLIYVVGGYDGVKELATVAVYDPAREGSEGGPWSERAPLSQPRGGLGVAVVGSQLYAVGGGWTQVLAFNEQYDLHTAAWSRFGTPVVGQWRNLGLAAHGQKLYAVGGWSGSYLNVNEEYLALIRQLLPLGAKGG